LLATRAVYDPRLCSATDSPHRALAANAQPVPTTAPRVLCVKTRSATSPLRPEDRSTRRRRLAAGRHISGTVLTADSIAIRRGADPRARIRCHAGTQPAAGRDHATGLPASSNSTTLSEWRPSLGAGSPLRTAWTKAAAASASGSSPPPLIVSTAAKRSIGTTFDCTAAGSECVYS